MSCSLCFDKIFINGTGRVKARPDIATVSIGAITENKSLKAAQEENARIMNNVTQTLLNAGVMNKDIQTQSYDIEIQYDFVDGKQIFRAYRVRNILKITIRNAEKVGEIVDLAVANGANFVGNINFDVSNIDPYYNVALNLALKQAVNKAEALQKSARIIVNCTPINIEELGAGSIPITQPYLLKAQSTTPISPGEIEIVANLKVVFEYKMY